MSLQNIKKAFEKKLAALQPTIQTSYEGVTFNPTSGVPYQRTQLVPRRTDNPSVGDDHYRDNGEFQIFLAYPTNKGTGEILTRAELVRDFFKRGTTLIEGDTTVLITKTPQIAGTSILGDRLVVPVIITYISDVNT